MSSQPLLAAEIPMVVTKTAPKQVKMMNALRKNGVLVVALVLAVYFVLACTNSYLKDKRYDRIMVMLDQVREKTQHVRRLDRDLSVRLARLDYLVFHKH